MALATTFPDAEWGECVVPSVPVSPALVAQVRQVVGAVPGWLARLAPCPWLVRALCANIGRPIAHAPFPLCDLIALVVSQDNSCRYCIGTQRAVLKIHGYRDDYIDRLVRDFQLADLAPRDRVALDFARRLSRADPLPGPADFQALVDAGFTPIAAAELAAVAASSGFANRVATLVALPAESLEQMVTHPLFRLMRPLIAWRMQKRPRAPESLPHPNDGPCARLVSALDGSPSAGVLRRGIDEACTSPILPRRTKMLMLAVVARALGCVPVEIEARAQLAADGLDAADVDEVLTTLGSPRLDAREARLLPFARETVRYQPDVIQRRFREVRRELSDEETLETVGIVALANAVCRLSVIVPAS
jgi:alkylhydroperoxidase family enzyme